MAETKIINRPKLKHFFYVIIAMVLWFLVCYSAIAFYNNTYDFRLFSKYAKAWIIGVSYIPMGFYLMWWSLYLNFSDKKPS